MIGNFKMPPINWGNAHRFQCDFEPTTQAFIDTFVSSGLSQGVTEPMFNRSGNILNLVFTSTIDRNGDVNIHCPILHCRHSPIVFACIFDFYYELTQKKLV